MPFALIAALCVLPASITFQVRAQPLGLLLPTLSEKVGRRLAAQPTLTREQLVIDVQNVEPNALLERIAEVTHAEWQEEPTGEYRLRRTPDRERALAAEEHAFHTANLRRQLKDQVKEPFDPKKSAQSLRDFYRRQSDAELINNAVRPDDPADRYLTELVLALPAEFLANLRHRQGIVYSNRPSGSQRPFPASLSPLIARVLRDQETFGSIIAPSYPDEFRDSVPVRVTLSLEANRFEPGVLRLVTALHLRDESGQVVGEALNVLSSNPKRPLEKPSPHEPTVNFSPLAREIESIAFSYRQEDIAGPPTISEALRKALLSPERDGHLTQTWSDVMFTLAGHERRSLVANLPDDAEGSLVVDPRTPVPLRTYIDQLTGVEINRPEGWITLRPRFPGPAGQFRADRAAVGSTVRSLAEGNSVSFEQAASVVARIGTEPQVLWHRLVFTDQTGDTGERTLTGDYFPFSIIDGLPPVARRALYNGRSLAFAQMPAALQAKLRDYYLNASTYRFLVMSDQAPSEDGDRANERDATELIGPAQVAGLTLTASLEEFPSFVARSQAAPTKPYFIDDYVLVNFFDAAMKPQASPPGSWGPKPSHVRVGASRTLTLTVHFPNGFRHEVYLSDFIFEPKAPFLPLDRLPASVINYLRERKQNSQED